MWKVGQRVFACRGSDHFWYVGTIRHIDGERCYVIFDDGEDALLQDAEMKPLELHIGDIVFARLPMEAEFKRAKIVGWDDEKVQVRWSSGQEDWTSYGMMRLEGDGQAKGKEPAHVWTEGDRVFACWQDNFWYPGVLLSIDGEKHHVLFDDGDQALVPAERLKLLELEVGDHVFCRWKGGPAFHPGEITSRRGEVIHIRYDDGDEETTSVRLVRIASDSNADLGQQIV